MLFCSAKMNEIQNLVKCLDKYGKWSGQSINLEKSGVFASKGVHSHFLRQIKNHWGLKKLQQGTRYLGISLFLSKKNGYSMHEK